MFFVRTFSVLQYGKTAKILLNSNLKVTLMKSIVQKLLKGFKNFKWLPIYYKAWYYLENKVICTLVRLTYLQSLSWIR